MEIGEIDLVLDIGEIDLVLLRSSFRAIDGVDNGTLGLIKSGGD